MEGIPVFPEFIPLDISHRKLVCDMLGQAGPVVSEMNFAEMFAWHRIRHIRISRHNGNIIIYVNKGVKKYIYPPLGKNDPNKSLIAILEWMSKEDPDAYAYGFDAAQAASAGATGRLAAEDDRDNADYIYSSEELINLSGRKFDGKRNHLKNFYRNFEAEYMEITPDMIPDIKEFQEHWCRARMCEDDLSLVNESKAVMEVLDNYAALPVFGAVLKINSGIQAFTIASGLNADTAVVLFEKARPEFRGIYQAINQQFCEKALKGYKWINREQDAGDEGLRKAKLSYNPARMEAKYTVSLKEE
jgi:hypothetical protein